MYKHASSTLKMRSTSRRSAELTRHRHLPDVAAHDHVLRRLARAARAAHRVAAGGAAPALTARPRTHPQLTAAAAPPPPPAAAAPRTPPPSPPPAFPAWLLVTVVFMHVLANAVIAQALPTALLSGLGNDRVRTARLLGRLSSLAALLDIVVTPQLGRLSDTIGRRPLLLAAPCVTLVVRCLAAARPQVAVLILVKLLSATVSSTYMVSLRAAVADTFK